MESAVINVGRCYQLRAVHMLRALHVEHVTKSVIAALR